eukprot:scaffold53824_cov47-Prasinocladus_malaysianus.AAC.1
MRKVNVFEAEVLNDNNFKGNDVKSNEFQNGKPVHALALKITFYMVVALEGLLALVSVWPTRSLSWLLLI